MKQSSSDTLYMARKMSDPKNSRHELNDQFECPSSERNPRDQHRMSYCSKCLVPRMNQDADHPSRDKWEITFLVLGKSCKSLKKPVVVECRKNTDQVRRALGDGLVPRIIPTARPS